MKLSLLGIAVILFGIALILVSSGSARLLGLLVSAVGLGISTAAVFRAQP